MLAKVEESAIFIKSKMGSRRPKIGVVLGSGLGVFGDHVTNKIEIPYGDIPNFGKTSVTGHAGKLIIGEVSGIELIVFQGRFHAYEGHSLDSVVLPVRVLKLIGADSVILTNASGGINSAYEPGDLVCITDHLNLTGSTPLLGVNEDKLGPRFPDMSETYKREFIQIIERVSEEKKLNVKKGIYAGVLGPAYETPAEIKMLKILGADMVGMSTVPEAIAANHAGLNICAISCITNYAAGISNEKLDHEDVKEVAALATKRFVELLSSIVSKIG